MNRQTRIFVVWVKLLFWLADLGWGKLGGDKGEDGGCVLWEPV